MANKGKIEHNNKRLKMAMNVREQREDLKKAVKNASNMQERLKVMFKLDKNPNKSLSRYRRRCASCGRPNGIMPCDICRIEFRKMANFGELAGVHKASW